MYTVRGVQQLRALRSPVRQAIVDVVAARGPSTIRDIAAEIGRPASALYHHVRALRAARLLTTRTVASERGRPGVVLDVPGRPLAIRYEPDDPRTRQPMQRIVGTMTRAATRDFARAYRPDVVVAGDTRALWASRAEAWLTRAEIRAINRLLVRLTRRMHAGRRPTRTAASPYSLTFVLAPVSRKQAIRVSSRSSPSRRTARGSTPYTRNPQRS